MTAINAIFRDGVFKPLEPVDLKENQRVRLSVEPAQVNDCDNVIRNLDKLQAEIVARNGGLLPDSTADIAEDRRR